MATIELENVTRSFPALKGNRTWRRAGRIASQRVEALGPIDLHVGEGEFVALLGPSGCGKSTVLHLLAALDEPSTGIIRIDGQRPDALQRRHELGIAFQEHALLPWRTVEENLRLPFHIAGVAVDHARIAELIALAGLRGFEHALPRALSGGMKQRVAIVRALALHPRLLLLDEPFGALDAVTRHRMNFELERIWMESRPTTVLVTHTVEEALLLASRVVVFTERPGRIRLDRNITFDRPRSVELTRSAEFHALADELTAALEPA
jgi:ABC-type nitrate/sulfonate/bicarbonate transport system, ATPase component